MIRVPRVPEPPDFDERARRPGNAWLAQNPQAPRPRDLWSPFRAVLAEGFGCRCGYSAMYEPCGTIDHLESFKENPALTYEWSNYRYASQWINSSKKTAVVLDPYEVEDDWFEVLLPSLELVPTDRVPPERRELAERTLRRLGLMHDERILRQRQQWYLMYDSGELSLEGLRKVAPLIAAAVDKAKQAAGTTPAG